MRNTFTAISLAAFLALAVVACTNGSNSGSSNGVLNVTSATPTQSGASGGTSHTAAKCVAGVVCFAFPAGVQVEFQSALPAKNPQRAAMIGYENYVDSMWYAVATHGSSKVYEKYVFGNALTFARSLVNEFKSKDYRLSGTIVYWDTSVPQVFYGAGAVVQSCVNATGLYRVNAKTGVTVGTIFSTDYDQYQEQASDGKTTAGYWTVSHTENFTATSGSAGTCI